MCYIMFMILMTGVGHIGAPHFIILDHYEMLKVTPAVQSVLLQGEDVIQGQFLPEMGDTEGTWTQGRPMAQGVQAGALVGAGAGVWTILGD
ncbi:hypothetical protein CRYUN_Cryun05aG0205300 [Craigia yunnanensis]